MNLRTEAHTQGLTDEEFNRIVRLLGREPNRVELGIFAALWSEHCCYKSSKRDLKTLPTEGKRLVQGPGENAGIIDLGDGDVLAFKVESHNHPSFIEPHQGAATGVGGILRDIFTMGARPIAVLDSLSFGAPDHSRTAYLVHGVVGGIGGYGNCMGIPTVGGEIHFDSSYNGNILVNAMAVGLAKKEMIHRACARGKGNVVVYLGSKTGRDGIHGATMASEEFGSGNEERRPTVQVGDPFAEKLVMEACLEMMEEKLLVGIQDMGAAGIACSTFEMAARGESGMDVNLDKIPLRESGMNAWEIFLSESQERMLLVATPEKLARIEEIARKWEIDCVDVGRVTNTGRVVARHHGEVVVDMAVAPLTDEAPLYERPWRNPKVQTQTLKANDWRGIDVMATVKKLMAGPNLSSRERVYSQYDHTVGADTVVLPGSDAAVMRIKGRTLGVGLTLDSNSLYCSADPYKGTMHVVAEAIRNLAATGARGVAVTNCLNFGNPEDPEVMGQLKESIRGLSEACRYFDTPVTGGNVSLYNQTGKTNIRPTPTIGMVGLLDDVANVVRATFRNAGEEIALVGAPTLREIYQSEFARAILGRDDLACPPIDLEIEKRLQSFLVRAAGERLLSSAHDCSEGGLLQTLVESCHAPLEQIWGASISLPAGSEPVPYLFGEYPSRAVVSFPGGQRERVMGLARTTNVPIILLGRTAEGDRLDIDGVGALSLTELRNLRRSFFEGL